MSELNPTCETQARGTARVADLLAGIAEVGAEADREVSGVYQNSRLVDTGGLFVATPGDVTDGRDYIDQAIARGASVIAYEESGVGSRQWHREIPMFAIADLKKSVSAIASRFYGNPSAKMKIVGVTGTNGKTTFSMLMTQAFELLGQKAAMMGTVGNGFPGSLEKSVLTTDNAIAVQKMLHELFEKNAETVCMEVSSHGLSQHRVDAVNFDVVVFTNLSQDHLDYHETVERYANEKKKLFSFDGIGLAVINHGDEVGKQLLKEHNAERCISYGFAGADVQCHDLVVDDLGVCFNVHWKGRVFGVESCLLGRVNVPNLLAVVACLLGEGFDFEEIRQIMPKLTPPPGRMEVFTKRSIETNVAKTPAKVIVDYAHTPDALERVLLSVQEINQGQLFVVFGCGGDRDKDKRAKMGSIAERYATDVIVTDDNPRTESPEEIVEQILSGMKTPAEVIHDRRRAIETAVGRCRSGDWLVIAGKGHEDNQTTKSGMIRLSDREIVGELMERLG